MTFYSDMHGKLLFAFKCAIFLFSVLQLKTVSSIQVLSENENKTECQRERRNGPYGTITSPGYPRPYSSSTSCSWFIIGKKDEIIILKIEDLDIEEDSEPCLNPPCCNRNWLKIGPVGEEKHLCGQMILLPGPFISRSNFVSIKFHTSPTAKSGRGFLLSFTVGAKYSNSCREDQFHCDNRKCIPLKWRCDNYDECGDGSDENLCRICLPDEKKCHTSNKCYEAQKHCDGRIDCADASDELNCGYCSLNETRCGPNSKQCYNPFIDRCNRILDCENGEDEFGCSVECHDKIMCASGSGCYTLDERCDSIAQCTDSSDEKNCGPDLCNSNRGGFLCNNKHCIRETWKCDRTNDCRDGSDENNCLKNSVITAATMGSLICGLLMVIAASCTCRLYALRFLEQRISRETPLSRLGHELFFPEPPPSYAIAVGEHQNLYIENSHSSVRRNLRPHRVCRPRSHSQSRISRINSGTILNPNCILIAQSNGTLLPCSSLPSALNASERSSQSSPSCSQIENVLPSVSVLDHLEPEILGDGRNCALSHAQNKNVQKFSVLPSEYPEVQQQESADKVNETKNSSEAESENTDQTLSLIDICFNSNSEAAASPSVSVFNPNSNSEITETNETMDYAADSVLSEASFNDTLPLISS